MDLSAVMDEISDRLTGSGLRCIAWPAGRITPPGAIVGYPTSLIYDDTPGTDVVQLPIVIVVGGSATTRASRDTLSRYVRGRGDGSIPALLETGTYTSFDTMRVISVEFDTYSVGSVDHVAAILDTEISGPH
jgi:hypothetical protein